MTTAPAKVSISNSQLFMMLIAVVAAFGHFVYIHVALVYAGRDTWIALLVGCALAAPASFLILRGAARNAEASLVDHTMQVWGNWFGALISLIYIAFFIFVIGITLKTVTDFMTVIYPRTPSGVFILLVLLPAAWGSYKGVEVLGRTMQFILPALIVLGVSASLLAFRDKDYSLLFPMLQNDWTSIGRGSLIFATMFAELIVFRTITHHSDRPRSLTKYGMVTVGILVLMFLGPATGPVALFGEHLAQSLAFPTYTEIQYIHVSNLIERLDIVGVLLWTNGSFLRVSMYLFASAKSMAEICNIKENTFVVPITILCGAVTSTLVHFSREQVYGFLGHQYIYIALTIGFGIPMLTGILSLIRKRIGKRAPSKRQTRQP